MKTSRLPIALASLATLIFAGCGNKEAEQQAAVQQFKTEIGGVAEGQKEKKKTPLKIIGTLTALTQLPERLRHIQTEKLPTDLKLAFEDFRGKTVKIEPILAELGATPADRFRTIANNPQAAQNIAQKIQQMLPELTQSGQKLVEVGKKYGIQQLADLVPQ